jgi:accessory gene regulator protein AgrB
MTLPDPTPPTDAEIRKRQKSRAVVTGIILLALVVLIYAITIAKMTVNR